MPSPKQIGLCGCLRSPQSLPPFTRTLPNPYHPCPRTFNNGPPANENAYPFEFGGRYKSVWLRWLRAEARRHEIRSRKRCTRLGWQGSYRNRLNVRSFHLLLICKEAHVLIKGPALGLRSPRFSYEKGRRCIWQRGVRRRRKRA